MQTPLLENHEPRSRVLDNLQGAVLLFDDDLRLQYINPAGEVLLAVSARHLIGQRACDLMRCPDAIVGDKLQHVLDSGSPITEREVSLPLADGHVATVDFSIQPISLDDGETGLLVEMQQVDRQLRITREEQLIAQQAATRDLVRGLAHEIKNPLGGLRGAAQLLARELGSAELEEYTSIIIEEADRLQALVDRMLGPNNLPRLTEVNIHQVLERVRTLVVAEAAGEVSVYRDYDISIPDLKGDADQLIQAFLNIVRNAVRATRGQADARIDLVTRVQRQFTIGSRRHRLVVQVDIVDNGPGIPPELAEKIFYPMVSASDGGVGVGLSIAQSLVNKHGGLIECSSTPGNTMFTVWLPLEI